MCEYISERLRGNEKFSTCTREKYEEKKRIFECGVAACVWVGVGVQRNGGRWKQNLLPRASAAMCAVLRSRLVPLFIFKIKIKKLIQFEMKSMTRHM
jgi:hypothetical protein